jgi:hypothetical protein
MRPDSPQGRRNPGTLIASSLWVFLGFFQLFHVCLSGTIWHGENLLSLLQSTPVVGSLL